eukprot:12653762-Alexandrium_andersonii.AAC.1
MDGPGGTGGSAAEGLQRFQQVPAGFSSFDHFPVLRLRVATTPLDPPKSSSGAVVPEALFGGSRGV